MISIEKWAGLVTNASPYSLPPGAAVEQVNMQVVSPGVLAVRPGLNLASVTASTASTSAVRSAFRYEGQSERVVWQDAAGRIYYSGAMQ